MSIPCYQKQQHKIGHESVVTADRSTPPSRFHWVFRPPPYPAREVGGGVLARFPYRLLQKVRSKKRHREIRRGNLMGSSAQLQSKVRCSFYCKFVACAMLILNGSCAVLQPKRTLSCISFGFGHVVSAEIKTGPLRDCLTGKWLFYSVMWK